MTELHCHILPGIDDGAKDVNVSIELLKKEASDGIKNIALTSHFNPERALVDDFISRRNSSYEKLQKALKETNMDFNFKLGAEVYFSPKLCEVESRKLCIGDTDYMLIEFSTRHRPHFIRETFYELQNQGIVPLIAHIERYSYVMEDLTILYDWVAAGAYAQINADSFIKRSKDVKLFCKLIDWNLVHFIATDTHSLDKRPPHMAEAFSEIEKRLGKNVVNNLKKNSDDIFNNYELGIISPHMPKKFLGIWR